MYVFILYIKYKIFKKFRKKENCKLLFGIHIIKRERSDKCFQWLRQNKTPAKNHFYCFTFGFCVVRTKGGARAEKR